MQAVYNASSPVIAFGGSYGGTSYYKSDYDCG